MVDETWMMYAETFLEKQDQLFDEPVANTPEEALDFLEDCYAQVFDSVDDVRAYFEENGTDIAEMDDEELLDNAEVFEMPDGKYLLVEA